MDLIVNFLYKLILSLLKDSILNLSINLLDLLDQRDCALSNSFDLIQDASNFTILAFQVLDQSIDTLQVLVPVDILWRGRPFLLHELKDLLFVLNFTNYLLEFLLQILDLLLLVAVFDALIRDLLLSHDDLFVNGLLEFFPLLFEFL